MSNRFPEGDKVYRLPPNELVPLMMAMAAAESRDWGHGPLKLPDVHAFYKGAGAKIAVLDTGCDLSHKDLKDRIAGSKDFTGSNSGASDVQGHGTHCAGIIGSSNNDDGLIGVAPECKLYIGKVLNDSGSGASSWIAAGIRWAVAQGVDVISMSLGAPSPDSTIRAAILEARAAGVLVICAAGNAGPSEGTVGFPGGYPDGEVVCIAAVDSNLEVANFSSRGLAVDSSGPGVNVFSTYPGGRYARMSGTSMATPYVAGCAGLASGYKKALQLPRFTQPEFFTLLQSTSKDLGQTGKDTKYGWGLIQPFEMLKTFAGSPPPPPPPPPPPSPKTVEFTDPELIKRGVPKIVVHLT